MGRTCTQTVTQAQGLNQGTLRLLLDPPLESHRRYWDVFETVLCIYWLPIYPSHFIWQTSGYLGVIMSDQLNFHAHSNWTIITCRLLTISQEYNFFNSKGSDSYSSSNHFQTRLLQCSVHSRPFICYIFSTKQRKNEGYCTIWPSQSFSDQVYESQYVFCPGKGVCCYLIQFNPTMLSKFSCLMSHAFK